MNDRSDSAGTLAWVGPFGVFALWLAIAPLVPLGASLKEILRDATLLASILVFSRHVLPVRAPHWMSSVALGVVVCAVWVAPDAIFPTWREHWLFQNAITGRLRTSIPPAEFTPLLLVLRASRAALLVPVIEELFWRGWLPRWIQDTDFRRIPLGQYSTFAFWSTALLFAAEHGPYWEVGLLCGIIYNWWMRRTRSLGDLVVVHATTNLALSVYVVATQRWTYWM